jgi:hypothetical protein
MTPTQTAQHAGITAESERLLRDLALAHARTLELLALRAGDPITALAYFDEADCVRERVKETQ